MLKSRLAGILAAFLIAGAMFADSARADPVSDFYGGKTVTIYVGYGAGGGYDAYAQLLSRFIARHIPGKPAIVVKFMPGADSMVLMNWLYNVAPRDGTAFGIIASGVPVSPLLGSPEQRALAKFDARRMGWLGSLEKFTAIGIAWHTSGFHTLDDLKKRPFRFASAGAASGGEVYAKILNETIGTKIKGIRGYLGSQENALAMERGEVDGIFGWCWTCMKADRPNYVTDKLVIPLVQFGLEPEPEMAGVPSAIDLARNEEDKQVWRLILGALVMSRPFVAPPGIPAARMAALRTAFNATAADPDFLAAAKQARRNIMLFKGEDIDALLKDNYSLPADIIERARKLSAP
jgi:tripartite-type tricarboxylate transporter receptor subunit TctC